MREFEELAHLAPPEDADAVQILIDHEVAFIEFAAGCRSSRSNRMDVLEGFIARLGSMPSRERSA